MVQVVQWVYFGCVFLVQEVFDGGLVLEMFEFDEFLLCVWEIVYDMIDSILVVLVVLMCQMMWCMFGVDYLMEVYKVDMCGIEVLGKMVDVVEGVELFLEKCLFEFLFKVLQDFLDFFFWWDELWFKQLIKVLIEV